MSKRYLLFLRFSLFSLTILFMVLFSSSLTFAQSCGNNGGQCETASSCNNSTGVCTTSDYNQQCAQQLSGSVYDPTGSCSESCNNLSGFGGQSSCTQLICCAPPPPPNNYDCGIGTTVPSYCHTGPQCVSGYTYSSLYGCDPSLWDGCCVQCPAAEGCFQGHQSTPYYVPNGNCGWTFCAPYCNSGSVNNCNTCSGGYEPANTCGYTGGSQTCYYTQNSWGACTQTSQSGTAVSCNQNYNACTSTYYCPGGAGYQTVCQTTLTAYAFVDYNHNGNPDSGEPYLNGVSVHNSETNSTENTGVSGNGKASFSGETPGGTDWMTGTVATPFNGYYFQSTSVTKGYALTNTNGNATVNLAFVPMYTISGRIYIDYNHNNSSDGGSEPTANSVSGVTGVTVSDGNGHTVNVASDGTFSFPNEEINNPYTLTITGGIPAGYQGTQTTDAVTVNSADVTNAELGITPLYQISGNIFNDIDLSKCYNPSAHGCSYNTIIFPAGADTVHTSNHITISGPTNTSLNSSSGSYQTSQTLLSGTYTVTDTTAPATGERFTTNNSWTVTLGDPSGETGYQCNIGSSTDKTNTVCTNPNNGSIAGLNFGLTNETAWWQPVCGDVRQDYGYSQPIPAGASCNNTSAPYAITDGTYCAANPGIVYGGGLDPNYGLGTGPSTSNMEIGNTTYPEYFTPRVPNAIETSYNFVMSTLNNLQVAATHLTSICPTSSQASPCIINEGTTGGVYYTNPSDGTIYLAVANNTDGTTQLGKTNYLFVLGSDVYIESNITLQPGYSAAFISGGDMHVLGNVGETDWTSIAPDIEGLFSADKNFDIDTAVTTSTCNANGTPIDKKLNVKGVVVTNAAGNGGNIVNNREGCLEDLSCPASTLQADPLQTLNPPTPLKVPFTFWQELNP